MRYNVTNLLKKVGNEEGIEFSQKFNFSPDIILTGPVKFKGEFLNSGQGIILEGNLKTDLLQICSRCLKEFNYKLELPIKEEFKKKISTDDESFAIDQHNNIELDEPMRQNIIVNLPSQPLCQKDCQGLKETAKDKKESDPRWEKLREIKQKME